MHYLLQKDVFICEKCLNNMDPIFKKFKLEGVDGIAIFPYNDFVRSNIYLLKGCQDYEMKDVFVAPFVNELKFMFQGYQIVPAPSSEERVKERGYNQTIEIFNCLGLPFLNILKKTKDVQQHSLSFQERQKIGEAISIDDVYLKNKKILLVDDILTTGATLKACVNLIKEKGPKKIRILVVAKREFTEEEKEKIDKNYPIF